MKHKIGIIGLIVGIIAVGLAIFQNDLRPQEPPQEPKPVPTLKELAVEAGKKVINDKILKKEEDPPPVEEDSLVSPRDRIGLTYMILGFLAMVLGIVSWVKKDHIRISGGSISLGLMAVAWQYVMIGVVIAVVILILANISA
jgi:hypothetical protein